MKQLLCLISCAAMAICSTAQDQAVLKIHEGFLPEPIVLPYKNIVVVDARFDRSAIGHVYNKVVLGRLTTKKRKAVFPDSLSQYLPQLLEDFSTLDTTSNSTLLVMVKKFRVAEHFITSVKGELNDYFILNLSATFYSLQQDSLTRLFTVENALSHYVDNDLDVRLSLQHLKNQRSYILSSILYKSLAPRRWTASASAPRFALTDMHKAVEKRFSLPVYTGPPTAGVYKTFDDFKKATPSDTAVYIRWKKNAIEGVFDKNGVEVLPQQVWGISDGKKNYISFRGEFVELLPSDRGFCIPSYRTHDELSGNAVMGDGSYNNFMGISRGGVRVSELFDLDMDTGQAYMDEVFGQMKQRTTSR